MQRASIILKIEFGRRPVTPTGTETRHYAKISENLAG